MWHLFLLLLVSTPVCVAQAVTQIDKRVRGFTAYDVLNYTGNATEEIWNPGVPLRILGVGDSITVGWGSNSDGGDGNGYRTSLAKHLSKEKVVFAGTEHDGSTEHSYDAAWSGQTIQFMSRHVTPSLKQMPNVILLHAGTNDMDDRPSISEEGHDPADAAVRLGKLIDQIIKACPDAVLLVAIPISSCDNHKNNLPKYRALIPGVVRKRRQDGKHVITVDFSTFEIEDLRDCVHPTNEGYSIMGDYWYDFLTQVPKGWIKGPVGDDPEREEENEAGKRAWVDKRFTLGIGLFWILHLHRYHRLLDRLY